jgi:mRNA-degrading endonuclease RelE of RelBE toxin-antitoxin system
MFKLFFSEHFKKQLRKLKKKFPHIKDDLLARIELFDVKTEISIGRSIYKIRIGSSDMQKGKSGGFRYYLYLYIKKDLLMPLCIYPKSQTESISENELQYHLDQGIEELFGWL